MGVSVVRLIKIYFVSLTVFSSNLVFSDTIWKPYVCKVMDFYDCQNGKKQIFPVSESYSDKETCYEEFEILLENDIELDRRYPQTDDPNESYIFGCVKE